MGAVPVGPDARPVPLRNHMDGIKRSVFAVELDCFARHANIEPNKEAAVCPAYSAFCQRRRYSPPTQPGTWSSG